MPKEKLIPEHGGYRNLLSFKVSQLVYDVTVLFCERYISIKSRTHDQMVQAARSGVQNIAEGSQASGTSKKFEIKLTNVARASLEELKLDYEDYLRQRSLPTLDPKHPSLMRFKERRCQTLEDVREWVKWEHDLSLSTDEHRKTGELPVLPATNTISSDCLAANAALSLLNLACYLLEKQVKALAKDFEENGGFTERMYRVRKAVR